MLNQSYNNIAELILNYFDEHTFYPGDRFYLQLESQEEIDLLLQSLQTTGSNRIETFTFSHEQSTDQYQTFSILLDNQIKLVIAATNDTVTADYLVMLRNQTGEQQGVWNNTMLLSIVQSSLESITNGSKNLQIEGMPLHVDSIISTLHEKIQNSTLSISEKEILFQRMSDIQFEQSFQQITFHDFIDIFKIVENNGLLPENYKQLGLFFDTDLESYRGKAMRERLQANKDLFQYIQKHDERAQLTGDYSIFEKKFLPKDIEEIKKNDWTGFNFSKIYTMNENFNKQNKHSQVKFSRIISTSTDIIWERPTSDHTAGGLRKRHVIIFSNSKEPITLGLEFDVSSNISKLERSFSKIKQSFNCDCIMKITKNIINLEITSQSNGLSALKYIYKHEDKTTLSCEFNILILPVKSMYFSKYLTNYQVDISSRSVFLRLPIETESLYFGDENDSPQITELNNSEERVDIYQGSYFRVTPLDTCYNDNDELIFNLNFIEEQCTLPCKVKRESVHVTPLKMTVIRKEKLKHKYCYYYPSFDNNKIIQGNRENSLYEEESMFIQYEKLWVDNGYMAARVDNDNALEEISLSLSLEMKALYSKFINRVNIEKTLPSLMVYQSDELRKSAMEYVQQYNFEINNLSDSSPAGQKGKDLFLLGTVESSNDFYLTPFHPLIVAYQLKLFDEVAGEDIDDNIIKRLTPYGLLPYIYVHNKLYRVDDSFDMPEWIKYQPIEKISLHDSSKYLATIVYDKLNQFHKHFRYLFTASAQSPLLINIININNDKEVVKGIYRWFIAYVAKNGLNKSIKIRISFYQSNASSSFIDDMNNDKLFDLLSEKEFQKVIADYSCEEIVNLIQRDITYYRHTMDSEFNYSHITFYNINGVESDASNLMSHLQSGITLSGLYSTVPYLSTEEDYRNGFGIGNLLFNKQDLLINTAYYCNELSRNMKNDASDNYRKGETIVTRTTKQDEQLLESIYQASNWVTIVDSKLDLSYFQNQSKLTVIHYNDQHSDSSKYDAITVTQQADQYHKVIRDILVSKDIEIDSRTIPSIIQSFNVFNGEWLLKIVGSSGHYDREKLSIISAIKYTLAYFYHPNITWIPISLEEILRIAGISGLTKSKGLFNLNTSTSASDDLLLIGVEAHPNQLKLHFNPVEVKIGLNSSSVINKAKKQISVTSDIMFSSLTEDSFNSKYFKFFFAQLVIVNSKKLIESNFWNSNQQYSLNDSIIQKLKNNDFTISTDLNSFIGKGTVLSFKQNSYVRNSLFENDILHLNFSETDGYIGLTKSMDELVAWIQNGNSDFPTEELISNIYIAKSNVSDRLEINETNQNVIQEQQLIESLSQVAVTNDNSDIPTIVSEAERVYEDPAIIELIKDTNTTIDEQSVYEEAESVSQSSHNIAAEDSREYDSYKPNTEVRQVALSSTNQSTENVESNRDRDKARILVGTLSNSTKKIYWEYEHSQLANRHLLISGMSGQGKTYLIQCLLLEQSKLGISNLIIDYTNGFLPNQLEPEFVNALGNKLEQRVVYQQKLPINPFKSNVRDIGGFLLPESSTDIAERVKNVFSKVYSGLGIQQLNSIYEVTKIGVEKYGDSFDLELLKELLEKDPSPSAKTALSQIKPLIDRAPFDSNQTFNWNDLIEAKGKVLIIQLVGYPTDIQQILTEFLLWDIWNYSLQNGTKDVPFPIVLDEAQNLDHREGSPTTKMLTEGRKFGISGWFATQFLKSQLDQGEIARLQNASQKIYFAQPEQELSFVANSLSKDPQERKRMEQDLIQLRKGQCIYFGPIEDHNGNLTPTQVLKLDITPLTQRIN
ncbi:DNA phosphorothioation-dependent restriction protein DptH [Paenibacillus sp. FSL W7-1287]|uniref:DNA phosphorothioation-dependent restriction protein DptH n=1 Tax=Paenibacillus sp. FSL W7-1287 TaxID=2954538 RepID=UPI0030F528BE